MLILLYSKGVLHCMQNCGNSGFVTLESFHSHGASKRWNNFIRRVFLECHWRAVCFSPASHKLGMSESFTKLRERSFHWSVWALQLRSHETHAWESCGSRTGFEEVIALLSFSRSKVYCVSQNININLVLLKRDPA